MKSDQVIDRLQIDSFFSIVPCNGLMVAEHNLTRYSEHDSVTELFNTSYGRMPALKFFGGFENGVEIRWFRTMSENELDHWDRSTLNDAELLVDHPDLLVYSKKETLEGTPMTLYYFITRYAALYATVNHSDISPAEAKSYHDMFATALPLSASDNRNTKDAPEADTLSEAERIFRDFEQQKKRILSEFNHKLIQAYDKFEQASYSQFTSIRRYFRTEVDDAGNRLESCVTKLNTAGQELRKTCQDLAFFRKMYETLCAVQDDLHIVVNLDTGDFGNHKFEHFVSPVVQELPAKWERIMKSHPDYEAEQLKTARESETARLTELIRTLEQQAENLKKAEPSRRKAVDKATAQYRESASTLQKRLTQAQERFDSAINADKNRLQSVNRQKDECERKIQQTTTDIDKTFFLAFNRKNALQNQLQELNQQLPQLNQQIHHLSGQIYTAETNKAAELEKIEQSHAKLEDKMQRAQERLEQLPTEIAETENQLTEARKRLERIPDMSLAELTEHTSEACESPNSDHHNREQCFEFPLS